MRIECENCNAAFTIGDSLLSDQPIGAQCPYCGHVKVVSKQDAGAAAVGAGPAPAPPPRGFSALDLSGPLGGPPSSSSFNAPPPQSLGAGGGLGPASTNAPSMATDDRFGSPDSMGVEEATRAADSATCQVCGVDLVDEFDKVIGLCETHQRDRTSRVSDPVPAAAPPPAQPPADLSQISIPKLAPPQRTFIAPAKRRPGGFGLKHVFMLIVLAGIGAGGYWVSQNQEKATVVFDEVRAKIEGPKTKRLPTMTNPLRPQLEEWRKEHSDVNGTPEEYMKAARPHHLSDTHLGYEKASKLLQRALLLDENNPEVIGLVIENMILWKRNLLSSGELEMAEAALDFAEQNAPATASVHRGRAALQIVRGDLNGCRTAAEKALSTNATDGAAKLLLASSFLQGNVALAIREAEAARQMLPALRRSDRLLARAYANSGRYGMAAKLLRKRLKADPKSAASHLLFGDLLHEVGSYDEALGEYGKAARSIGDLSGARLKLATAEIERGNADAAAKIYTRILKKPNLIAAYRVEALTGLARAQLERGRVENARRLADQALSILPRSAPALLVRAQAALGAGSSTTAAVFARRALDARGGEPAALVVLGQAATLEQDAPGALKRFEEAIQNNPQDPRLRAVLAAMYISFGGTSQAFSVMRKVSEIDPAENPGHTRRGLLTLGVGSQRWAIAQFKAATKDKRNRSVAFSSIAVIKYHLGDLDGARDAVKSALAADESNLTARLYEAQLALERGAFDAAEEAGRTVLDIDRSSALGHLMLGRIFQRRGKLRDAKDEFDAALRSSPGLTIAKVELAGLALRIGQKDEAIDTLKGAFSVYPSIIRTRRLLYDAGY